MPRASSSSGGPVLRRNQACRTCRKKKLKCDAARPHCGNCVKAWKGMISVPPPEGYNHPEEPQCSYDPIEGLTLSDSVNPAEKIRQLEEQVSELKRRLQDAGVSSSPSASEISNGARPAQIGGARLASFARPSFTLSASASPEPRSEIALPRAGLDVRNGLRSTSPASMPRSTTSSPEIHPTNDLVQLMFLGWNADLPGPVDMRRLIDAFFAYDPCASRILHRPSFLASMLLSPRDARFPHSALLHAICASASRWVSTDAITTEDGIRRDKFSDYHAGKTRQYIDRTMASGADIFHVLQACTILSWYFYSEGRWVEVWIFSAFQTRVAIPLRLNYPGTFTTHGSGSPGAYLAPPRDQKDLESRRRTWWMSLVFDRIVSVGGWLHSVEYRHIATELPLRRVDFESDQIIPSNSQNLATPEVFTSHPLQYTDSFLLLIKAVMLFGKVTDFNNEYQLENPTSPLRTEDPSQYRGFRTLDKLVAVDFLESLPPFYKDYLKQLDQAPDSLEIDTDLYLVHLIPHAATITLHNAYINFEDEHCRSVERCVESADAILSAYYIFTKVASIAPGSLWPHPITNLHPFVTICWYLAAVVKIQVCKHMIRIGDTVNEFHVWGEINVLRMAMIEYGAFSPVGVRQERLLMQLMEDIVRTTTQDKPLEVGIRLYPFSHRTAFQGNESSSVNDTGAPLPISPPAGDSNTTPGPISVTPQQIPPGWSSRSGLSNSSPSHSSGSFM